MTVAQLHGKMMQSLADQILAVTPAQLRYLSEDGYSGKRDEDEAGK